MAAKRLRLPYPHPTCAEHTHANLMALDTHYGTATTSPLHHDNACPLHSPLLQGRNVLSCATGTPELLTVGAP